MNIKRSSLDSKFSKLMRLKFPMCQICGTRPSTQIHHFKSRRYQSVRFDPDNIICCDFSCHRKMHEDPIFAVEFMKRRLGVRYDSFVLKANMICKRYAADKKMLEVWIDYQLGEIQ